MKNLYSLTSFFILAISTLSALPENAQIASGEVEFSSPQSQFSQEKALTITASDKSIINYEKFSIGEGEKVKFIQPSETATVLNRVIGKNPSEILGELSSNGRVFLVNPQGIYFGKEAEVNAGSFVASTLNILDEDFIKGSWKFFLEEGFESSKIVNDGKLFVSNQGFIALLSPFIENNSLIYARAGSVILSAGKAVTLDFDGDGLIQFSVEGDLANALIENTASGKIFSDSGNVLITAQIARKLVQTVVNTEGAVAANEIIEENGEFHLVNKGSIKSPIVHIEGKKGANTEISGEIDASSSVSSSDLSSDSLSDVSAIFLDGSLNESLGERKQGGEVYVLGDIVSLKDAKIDASGDFGGGKVLIGGDYQGKGQVRNAKFTTMDESSEIYADSYLEGDGGKVILWSDDTTIFDGKIFVRGGKNSGNGGFVETSGKENLGSQTGYVNALAEHGLAGNWLLDPRTINIVNTGTATIAQCSAPNCNDNTTRNISPATIAASAANVALCSQRNANSSITVTDPVTMTNAGVSLTLTAGSGSAGPINLNANITTRGALIGLTGVVKLGAGITLDTTNAGGSPAGGDISFSNTVDGAQTLTLNAGTGGTVTFTGIVGGTTPPTSLTITNANNVSAAAITAVNITQSAGQGTSTFSTLTTTAASTTGVTLAGTNFAFNGAVSTVGATNQKISVTNSGTATISANMTTASTAAGTISFSGPVSLGAGVTLDTTNAGAQTGANITLSSTVNGAQTLALRSGTTGSIILGGSVGGVTPLTSLTVTSCNTLSAQAITTTGLISVTNSGTATLNNNITTAGGAVSFSGAVALATGAITVDTTNSGGTPAGAAMTFSSTVNGAQIFTVRAGTGGNITFTGAVGGATPLSSLTITSANNVSAAAISAATITQSAGNGTSTFAAMNTTAIGGINLTGTNFVFNTALAPLASGPIVVTNSGTATINASSMTTIGAAISFSGAVALGTGVTLDTTNAGGTPAGSNITLSSTVNGGQTLALRAGTGGAISLGGAVGGVTPLTSLTVVSCTTLSAQAITTSGLISVTNSGIATLNGNLTTSGGAISFSGAVALATGAISIDTTNAGGTPAGAGITFSSTVNGAQALTVRAGTGGNITFTGAVGGGTPLTSLTITSANDVSAAAISAGTITQSAGSGTSTFSSLSISAGGAGGIGLTGTAFAFNGAVSTVNATTTKTIAVTNSGTATLSSDFTTAGGVISFSGAVALGANVIIDTTNAGGTTTGNNITFSSTITNAVARTLELRAGTDGTITLSGAVGGGGTPLTSLTITNANNVSAAALTVGTLTQSAGNGTSTFNGAILTTGAIALTGTNFTFNSTVNTQSAGAVTVTNSGSLTLSAGANFSNLTGFTQNGAGTNSLNANITAGSGNISFATGVEIVSSSILTASGGNILFTQAVNGPGALTLSASGNVTFTVASGNSNRIGALVISTATDISTLGLRAASINATSTGTASYGGDLNTNAIAGISLAGAIININGNIITTNLGPCAITNSGLLTLTGGASTSITGDFTQSGGGSVSLTGTVKTVDTAITFTNNITLTGAATTIDSGTTGGAIQILGTINGTAAGSQTLALWSGNSNDITLSSAIGGTTYLSDFTISEARNVSTKAITATSISQLIGTGTTTFDGALITKGASGISLTGTAFIFTSNASVDTATTGAGTFSINNSGTANFQSGATCTIGSSFSQTGSGGSTLSRTIQAEGTIAFSGPVTISGTAVLDSTYNASSNNITMNNTINGTGGAGVLTFIAGATGDILLSGLVGGSSALTSLTVTSARNVTVSSGITAGQFLQSAGDAAGTTIINGPLNIGASGVSLTAQAITFNSTTTTTSGGNVTLANAGALTINSGATFNVAGNFDQTGAGAVALSAGITTTSGYIQFLRAVTLGASVALVSGNNIAFSSTVNGNAANTRSLTLTAASGTITLSGIVGGTNRLNILTIANAAGVTASAAINAVSITQTAGTGTAAFSGPISTTGASGISLTGAAFTFNPLATVTTTNAGPCSISNTGVLTINTGATFTLSGAFTQTTPGGGTVSLGDTIQTSNAGSSFASDITLIGPAVVDAGTGVGDITFSGTINGANTFSVLAGPADIFFNGVIGGSTALSSLSASGDNISFNDIGTSVPAAGVSGATTITAITDINFNGTTYTTGDDQSFTAGSSFAMNAGALTTFTNTSNTKSIDFTTGTINLAASTDLTINSTNGAITTAAIDAASGDLRTLIIDAGTAAISVGAIGQAESGEFAAVTLGSATGGNISLTGNLTSSAVSFLSTSGNIYLGGDITSSDDITFPVAVIRNNVAVSTISTAAAGKNIIFSSTINGDADNTRSLTVTSGTGNITFTGIVGGTHPLNVLTISTAYDVAAAAISAVSIVQSAGTNLTTFNGALTTTGAAGISLTGVGFTIGNSVTATGGGPLTVSHTGVLTISDSVAIALAGLFSESGTAGTVSLGGDITTTNGAITFNNPITLTNAAGSTLDSSAGNQNITIAGTVDGTVAGTEALTLSAGLGDVSITGEVGSTTRIGNFSSYSLNFIAKSLTCATIHVEDNDFNNSGLISFGKADPGGYLCNLDTNAADAGNGIYVKARNMFRRGNIHTVGGDYYAYHTGTRTAQGVNTTNIGGSFIQDSPGTALYNLGGVITAADNISFVAIVTLTSNPTLTATTGNISITGTINGSYTLTLSAGGDVTLGATVGGINPITRLIISTADSVTTQAIYAGSILQSAGSVLTDFQGAITTTGLLGIVLTGEDFTFGGTVSASGRGPVTITNAGALTISSGANFSLTGSPTSGAFSQTNGDVAATVSLAANITTSNEDISFAAPVTLEGGAQINSNGGDITFSDTVDSDATARSLTLSSGAGDIHFVGAVGSINPLNVITISSAAAFTADSTVSSASILQSAGTGTTTFTGAVATTALAGIVLTGTNFTFGSTVATAAAGPVTIVHSGALTISSGANFSLVGGGSFTQVTGSATVSLAANITTANAAIYFGAPVTLGGASQLTSAGGTITFNDTVDSDALITPRSLTLSSGAGNILFTLAVGGTYPLNILTVSTAADVTAQAAVYAASIVQSAGTGTTEFQGIVTTTGASGISLTGTNITFENDVTTTGSGPIAIINSGVFTTSAGKVITASGSFSQTGGGTLSLAGTIASTKSDPGNTILSFTNPITLTAATILSVESGSGNIVTGALATIDGTSSENQNLTIKANATSDIILGADLGGIVRLGATEVTDVKDVNLVDITALSIRQSAGSGTSTMNGDFNTTGANGVVMIGTNFTRNGDIIIGNGGSLTVTHTGTITGNSGNTTTIGGSYIINGTSVSSLMYLGGTVTANVAITITTLGTLTLASDAVFNSSGANGDITISSAINNLLVPATKRTLTFIAGAGDILLSGDIGNTNPIGSLTITSADDFTAQNVSAESITQTAGIGLTTFNGAVATTGASGISLTGLGFSFADTITTTGTGSMAVVNSGVLTLANAKDVNIAGSFSQSGTGTVSMGGDITTTSGTIGMASAITLTHAVTLDSSAADQNISLSGTVDGAYDFTLSAGGGDIELTGNIGQTTRIGSFTATSLNFIAKSLRCATIDIEGTDYLNNGLISFGKADPGGYLCDLDTNSNIAGNGIYVLAHNMFRRGNIHTTGGSYYAYHTGTRTAQGVNTTNIGGSFIQDSTALQTYNLAGVITASDDITFAAEVTLTGNPVLTATTGNISITNIIDDNVAYTHTLTLTAGGNITLGDAVGGVAEISQLNITTAADVTTEAVSAGSILQSAGSGLAHFQGALTTNGGAGIVITSAQIEFDAAINTINAGFGGPLTLVHTGSLTFASAADMTLDGAFQESGGGAVSIGSDIDTTSNGSNVYFDDAVTLTDNVDIDLGAGGEGNIHFLSTIASASPGPYCLTLRTGTGIIEMHGAVGAASPYLGCLTATAADIYQYSTLRTSGVIQETGFCHIADNITTTNSNITFTGNVEITGSSVTINSGAGAGNVSITGTLDCDENGRNFAIQAGTGDITIGGDAGVGVSFGTFTLVGNNITWQDFGAANEGAEGLLTVTAAAAVNFEGTTYHADGGQIYTAGTFFNFNAATAITVLAHSGNIDFNTGTISITSGAYPSFSIISNGTAAGSGDITFGDLIVAGDKNIDVTLNSSLADVTIGQIGEPTNYLDNFNVYYGTTFTSPDPIYADHTYYESVTVQEISGNISWIGTVTYGSPLKLIGDTTIAHSGDAGTLTFNQIINGDGVSNRTLTIQPDGLNNVVFNSSIGSSVRIAMVIDTTPNDVTFNSGVNVLSFSETGGTGTLDFESGISSTAAAGISINTHSIVVKEGFTTTNGGPVVVTIDNAGTFSMPAATTNNISGYFDQNGTGAVTWRGNLTVSNALNVNTDGINFAGPVVLGTNSTFNTSSASASYGDIVFQSTIDGSAAATQNLTLTAGTNDITVNGKIGDTTELGILSITSAANATFDDTVEARRIEQLGGTGTTTFSGAVAATGAIGVNVIGTNFVFDDTVTTAALSGGSFAINNSGALEINGVCSIDGSFTQTGAGLSTVAADITTTTGVISFAGAVDIDATPTLTTTNNQTITFTGAVNGKVAGTGDLTTNSGTAATIFSSSIGSTRRLGALVTSSSTLTTGAITAASIATTSSSTKNITGDLNTSGALGIALDSTGNITIVGNIITTGGGNVSIDCHTSQLDLTAGSSTSISGTFSQTSTGGAGTVRFSGTLLTSEQNISFADPVTLTGASTFSTGASGAGTITFSSTVNGGYALSLTAGTGDVVFGGNLGSISALGNMTVNSCHDITYPTTTLLSLTQLAASGTITVSGPILASGAGGISLTGDTIIQNEQLRTLYEGLATEGMIILDIGATGSLTVTYDIVGAGNVWQKGAGAVDLGDSFVTSDNSIQFDGVVTISDTLAINTGTTGQDIIFSQTVNDSVANTHDLVFTAGTGTIYFYGNVGDTAPLKDIQILSAGDIFADGTIDATSLTQTNGTGETTLSGAVTTSGNINLAGTDFTFSDAVESTGGNIIVNNTGTFTLESTGSIIVDAGYFHQNGAGGSIVSGNITTTGGDISFIGSVQISTGVSAAVSMTATNQNISFADTVNGTIAEMDNLTLDAGTGNISFTQNAGSTTRLGNLYLVSATNITYQNLTVKTLKHDAWSGTASFLGDLNTSGVIDVGGIDYGIHITGTNTFRSGAIITTNGGNLYIYHTGSLSGAGTNTTSIDGFYNQAGTGTVNLGGTVGTKGYISYSGPVTLASNTILNTLIGGSGGTGADVSFLNTLDGNRTLGITAGVGSIYFRNNIGAVTSLGAVTINSTADVTFAAIADVGITASMASLTQHAGSGTTSFGLGTGSSRTCALSTTGPSGIYAIGTNFYRRGSFTTTNGGPLYIYRTGTITGGAPNTTNINGTFTLDGPSPTSSLPALNMGGVTTITATGGAAVLIKGPVVMIGNATISSGTNGPVTFTDIINGNGSAYTLTITTTTGIVTFSDSIGATTSIGALNITGGDLYIEDVGGASAGVSGATTISVGNDIWFNGTTYNANAQSYTAAHSYFIDPTPAGTTTFTSSGDNISFSNSVPLIYEYDNDLVINSSGGNITLPEVHAQGSDLRTLTLNAGAGDISIGRTGALNNDEFSLISLTGNNITMTGEMFGDTVTLAALTKIYAGGNITTTDTALTFTVPVEMTASRTFSTGTTGAAITFDSTLDGDVDYTRSVTLSPGANAVTFTGEVGGIHPLNLLTISNASDVEINDMTVNGFTQSAGTGTTTFNGTVAIDAVSGISVTTTHITIDAASSITTAASGAATLFHSGTFNFAGSVNSSGAFNQSGSAGTVAFSGTLTSGSSATFAGAVTLSGTPSVDTSAANGAINFSNTVDGVSAGVGDLTLNAGTLGNITFSQNAGSTTRLGNLYVVSAQNITYQALTAKTLEHDAWTGTAYFYGNLNTNGVINILGTDYGIYIVGTNIYRSGSIITTNGGNLYFNHTGISSGAGINTTSIDGFYYQAGSGTISPAGTVGTNGYISYAGVVTLSSDVILNTLIGGSGGTGADITFSNSLNGGSDLTMIAGVGNVVLPASAGSSTRLGAVAVTSANNVTTQSVTATSFVQAAGTGTTTLGALNLSGATGLSITTTTKVIRNGAWTTTLGPMTIAAPFESIVAGNITSQGAFTQSGGGAVLIQGNLTTTNAAISISGAVELNNTTSLSSGTGAGNILFSSTINGAQNLTLNAGTGNLTVSGSIGNSTRLGNVVVNSATTSSFGYLRAASFSQLQGFGTTTLGGIVDMNGATGISIASTGISLTGATVTTTAGGMVLANTGLLTISSACTSAGVFTQSGLGNVSFSGSIVAGDTVCFAGAISLSGTPTIDTSAAGAQICAFNTIDGSGSFTLDAGIGDIEFQQNAGATTALGALVFTNATNISTEAIRAVSITQTAAEAGGLTTIIGDMTTTAGNIDLTGVAFTIEGTLTTTAGNCDINHTGLLTLKAGSSTLIDGSFEETGGGNVSLQGTIHASLADVTFNDPIMLTAATTLNSNADGDITINDTIDGNYDLVFTAGTGDIYINADIGSVDPVNSLTITSVHDVILAAGVDIAADYIVQQAGTGTTHFTGTLATTALQGIVLTGTNFIFDDTVTTTNDGPVTITNSGTLTINFGAAMTIDGAFSQYGGAVTLSDNIATGEHNILFSGAVTLGHAVSLDTGTNNADITFSSTVNGAYDLTMDTALGDILFSSGVGQTTPLAAFIVTGCGNFTSAAIKAASMNLSNVFGTANFNGLLYTTGALGITLSGNVLNINSNVTTESGGHLDITDTGILNIGPSSTLVIDGHFTQTGISDVYAGGSLTTNNQDVEFEGEFHLNGDFTINTGSGAGDITFNRTINDGYSLSCAAGTGSVMVLQPIGGETPLVNITMSGTDVTIYGIGNSAIAQGATGIVTVVAIDDIDLDNPYLNAAVQSYTAGVKIEVDLDAGGVQRFISTGNITFSAPEIQLGTIGVGNDLLIQTGGGNLYMSPLVSTEATNFTVQAGTGDVYLSSISAPTALHGDMNGVTVAGKNIYFGGEIYAINTNFTATNGSILNSGSPVTIHGENDMIFNSYEGNVGSYDSPIDVSTPNQVYAGAENTRGLAIFTGTTGDNTINDIPDNTCCILIFNGTIIHACNIPPPPPVIPPFPYAVPGIRAIARKIY